MSFSRGLGCPQQAKRDAGGGEAVIRISEKDILIHCLPNEKRKQWKLNFIRIIVF